MAELKLSCAGGVHLPESNISWRTGMDLRNMLPRERGDLSPQAFVVGIAVGAGIPLLIMALV
jgi:hypothetical protein